MDDEVNRFGGGGAVLYPVFGDLYVLAVGVTVAQPTQEMQFVQHQSLSYSTEVGVVQQFGKVGIARTLIVWPVVHEVH